MGQDVFTGLPEGTDVYVGLLGTRWVIERDGVGIRWRGRDRRFVPFRLIEDVELRPLTALTRGSIRLRVAGVPAKQIAADEHAVLNAGMPLRPGPVNAQLSAFAARIEQLRAAGGVDLGKAH